MKKKIIIVIIGITLAYWIFPPGLLATSADALTLRQIVRGAASIVIFFWTLTLAANI